MTDWLISEALHLRFDALENRALEEAEREMDRDRLTQEALRAARG